MTLGLLAANWYRLGANCGCDKFSNVALMPTVAVLNFDSNATLPDQVLLTIVSAMQYVDDVVLISVESRPRSTKTEAAKC